MNYYALPTIATGLILAGIGIIVSTRGKRSKASTLFGLFCFSMVVWLIGFSMMYLSHETSRALIWSKIGFMGIVFVPMLAYHFMITLIGKRNRWMLILYLIGIPSILLNFLTNSVYKTVELHWWGYYPVAGPLYFIFLFMFVILFSAGIYRLYLNINNEKLSILQRQQIKYICVGFGPGVVAVVDYLTKYPGINIYPFGYIFTLIFTGIVAFAILRYRLMDVSVAVMRASIFILVYSLVLGLPFWFGYRFGYDAWTMVLLGILATAGPLGYRFLNRKAENLLLAEQRRYQKILLQASEGMAKQHNLDKLLKLIVYIIKRAVNIKFAAAFLYDKEEKIYRLKALRDSHATYPEMSFSHDHPLVRFIQEKREPFTSEELPEDLRPSINPAWGIHLIVPSFTQNTLIGFLVLGDKLNNTVYSKDDISVFVTLSNQAALAIENCLFMDEFKKAQERMFNAEKLASIGGMADGLAHQIKNRLNQFSVVAGEQKFELQDILDGHKELLGEHPELKKSIDYLMETSDSMISNVKKTAGIVQGILSFAKIEQKETFFGEFALGDIIAQSAELLKIKHQLADFPVTVEVNSTDTIYGVKSQIMECLYNILDNAYEAVKEKIDFHLPADEKLNFVSQIRVKLTQKERLTAIEVSDNGIGIKDEHKKKVFAPFFTTKSSYKSGSGIGVYVVRRMIEENHGGKIRYESVYGQGTTVSIELPKKG